MTEQTYPIERALVVANEHSSNIDRVRRQIGRLALPTYEVLTSPEPEEIADGIMQKLTDGMVILGGGGDGTTHAVANILLSPGARELGLNNVPFVPLRGGNANDIAMMINGRKSAADILRNGRQLQLRPLEIVVNNGDPRFALGYFSVGGTAAASAALTEVKRRSTTLSKLTGIQFGREAVAAWLHTADQSAFTVSAPTWPVAATDVLFMRGDRIAKIGRPHANLAHDEFEAVTIRSRGRLHALSKMFELAGNGLHGAMVNACQAEYNGRDPLELLPVQYDGEAGYILSGSNVHVTVSEHSYTTLSTRL